MRFADRPAVEVDVHVDAPPERLWPLVVDIDLPAQFSSELQGAEWLPGASDPGPAVGASFRGRNTHPARGGWETVSVVTACEEPRLFAWAVGDPATPSASWAFELTPEPGGTRLRQRAELGPGPSGLTRIIESMPDKEELIIARRLEEHQTNMKATLEGMKALAEGDPG